MSIKSMEELRDKIDNDRGKQAIQCMIDQAEFLAAQDNVWVKVSLTPNGAAVLNDLMYRKKGKFAGITMESVSWARFPGVPQEMLDALETIQRVLSLNKEES